eukprot:4327254-Pleurochrysis_carterae.AAC.1
MDCGQLVDCQHMLWARTPSDAVDKLLQQRTTFLRLRPKERAQVVLDAITFPTETVLHGWVPPMQKAI